MIESLGLLASSAVIAGWFAGLQWLTTWGGDVTSKIMTGTTLFAMFVCQVILRHCRKSDSFLSLAIALIASASFVYTLGVGLSSITSLSINDWIVHEPQEWATYSVQPGLPSMATAAVVLVHSLFFFAASIHRAAIACLHRIGQATFLLGGVAMFGHLAGAPLLTFYYPGISTAVAVPTAVCFLILGIADAQICQQYRNPAGASGPQ